jgi:hypothetical protein
VQKKLVSTLQDTAISLSIVELGSEEFNPAIIPAGTKNSLEDL